MRIAMFGLIAATAALCASCGPAVGSKEWCDNLEKNPPKDFNQITPEIAKGMQQCVMNAINGMQ
jgi:hypothetical protein